ncbi:metal-binding protein [filamentous cyanobacterium CCP2]|nr:metal-binding protein [filamentous cyanobacterium CCP2]
MDAIYIPQLLKAPEQTEEVPVREYLPDLKTLTPVQGLIRVTHRGNYLEVAATAEAIMTLTCDRCLQQYNHRVTVDTSELIWLQESPTYSPTDLEQEIALDDLVETLPPTGHFQPGEWLYEQLCLAMPQRQLCDQDCQGIQVETQLEGSSPVDQRWASLKNLRNHLN